MTGQDIITVSRLKSLWTCPFQHYIAYEIGCRPDRTAQPLRMGTAFHDAIDGYNQNKDIDAGFGRIYDNYANKPEWADQNDWDVEQETVLRLFAAWCWRWENDGIEVIESEKVFRLPIINPETGRRTPNFDMGGKRDRKVRLPDGRIAVQEFKTCGESIEQGADYWKKLEKDVQVTVYFDMDAECEAIAYCVTRKPCIEPKMVNDLDENGKKIVLDRNGNRVFKKNGEPRESGSTEDGYIVQQHRETAAEYGERLARDIESRPDFYFQRREIPRLTNHLARHRQDIWDEQQMLRQRQIKNAWPQRSGEHCNWCQAKGPCFSDFDFSTGAIPQGFRRVENIHEELQIEEKANV